MLAKSAEQGRPWYNLAYAMWIDLDKAYDALNVAPPTHEPAASGHVPEMIEIIVTLIGRGPRIRSRGQLRGRLLRRAVTARVRRAHRPEARGYGPLPKMPTRAVNGTARLRAVEGLEAGGGAGERGVAKPVGSGATWRARRVLGDGAEIPRGSLRHPWRWHRPALPAPREEQAQSRAVGAPVRVVLGAQRLDHHLRRKDEQVARQLTVDSGGNSAGTPDRPAVLPGRRALPVALGVQLRSARGSHGRRPRHASRGGRVHNFVREGHKLLAVGASEKLRAAAGAVRAMLGCWASTRWTSTGKPARPHGRSGYPRR